MSMIEAKNKFPRQSEVLLLDCNVLVKFINF